MADADIEDPLQRFGLWFEEAEAKEPNDPSAMALATVGADGMPSVRMVLLKGVDPRGFVFYTNLESRKGQQLAGNPQAALCFHWKSLRRSVRIEGTVEPVSAAEADAYFATRPRVSQLGAWASDQSAPLRAREELEKRFSDLERKYQGKDVPRPPHWSGYRVAPLAVEFWENRPGRLHQRELYARKAPGAPWTMTLLNP